VNKNEFLKLFKQCLDDCDIDINFVVKPDEYSDKSIKMELEIDGDIVLTRDVIGFNLPF